MSLHHYQCRYSALCVSVALLLIVSGCWSSAANKSSQNSDAEAFQIVQQCFVDYVKQNGRPPSSPEDLVPLLKEAGVNPLELVETLGGGDDVVVLWGVMPDPRLAEPIVMGYQKESTDGKRLVITSKGVSTMTDDEFYSAHFPPGHRAPPRSN